MKKSSIIILISLFASVTYAQVTKLKPLKSKEMVGELVPVQKKEKWGYAFADDPKQKLVIKNVFEEARPFVDSVAIVKDEGKYGLLHRNGTLRLLLEYDEMKDFENGVSQALQGNIHVNIMSTGAEKSRWTEQKDGSVLFETPTMSAFKMIRVKKGAFFMGSLAQQEEMYYDAPHHEVRISEDFHIGETEVTQQLWNTVMGTNPSANADDNKPVENISFEDCLRFTTKLSDLFVSFKFRLPTEAEWEFAATSRGFFYTKYAGADDNSTVAWTSETSEGTSHTVKGKQPNQLGLYDMSGNVAEWCSDWYNSNYYKVCPFSDPEGPSSGKGHVVRGGNWKLPCVFSTKSMRTSHAPAYKDNGTGLRIVF